MKTPSSELLTNSAEGGYEYIYGGPYDAEEELKEMFEGVASELLITAAVAQVERRGGPEWTHTAKHDNYERDDELDSLQSRSSLDHIPDHPGPAFGTAEDRALREQSLVALNDLILLRHSFCLTGFSGDRPQQGQRGRTRIRVRARRIRSVAMEFGT